MVLHEQGSPYEGTPRNQEGWLCYYNRQAGYNEYYIVPAGTMGIHDAGILGVDENTSKGQLKTAFMKSQKNKFGSRILADRMLTLIV